VRRRASRAAGPAKSESSDPITEEATVEATVEAEAPPEPKRPRKSAKGAKGAKAAKAAKAAKPLEPRKRLTAVRPPPRRPAHRRLVGWTSLAFAVVLIAALGGSVYVLVTQQREADAKQARDQRFVDTATQMVVNMFSYTPDTIDEAVNRFVNSTSGPLRGMLSANNAADNLKGLFRQTNATSEAVINGAALEEIDTVSDNASVLVSVRVTVADIDGVNKPSMPYRLRVIVHEDETGRMTGYDLKYPNGGN
jgi:Mce-associated membrane protein